MTTAMSSDPCTLPPVACDLLATIPAERKSKFDTIAFRSGSGRGENGHCAEEALAFLAGDPVISDAPSCACPVIRRGTIAVNDSWVWESDAERTEALRDVVLAQLGSRSTPQVEEARRIMAVRFAVKVAAPYWLRKAGLTDEADALAALVITPETLPAVRDRCRQARSRADAYAAAYTYAYAADAAAAAADAYAAAYTYAYADDAYAAAYTYAYAAAAADARNVLRGEAKALVTQFVGVLRAMCDVVPETAVRITGSTEGATMPTDPHAERQTRTLEQRIAGAMRNADDAQLHFPIRGTIEWLTAFAKSLLADTEARVKELEGEIAREAKAWQGVVDRLGETSDTLAAECRALRTRAEQAERMLAGMEEALSGVTSYARAMGSLCVDVRLASPSAENLFCELMSKAIDLPTPPTPERKTEPFVDVRVEQTGIDGVVRFTPADAKRIVQLAGGAE